MTPKRSRRTVVQPQFLEELAWWIEHDRRVAIRVLRLVRAVQREPTTGIGKPERLRFLGPDFWSRRITGEHRLVYRVTTDTIEFIQARRHY